MLIDYDPAVHFSETANIGRLDLLAMLALSHFVFSKIKRQLLNTYPTI